jgi:hypothetical protein
MQKALFLLLIFFLTSTCKRSDKNVSDKTLISSNKDDSLLNKKASWVDSLIVKYINHTDNELIKIARKDTVPIEWLLDSVENTDTAKYLLFNIGHDVKDSADKNKRFVTDGWVYIDSLTQRLYEYNLATDNLIEWKNKSSIK